MNRKTIIYNVPLNKLKKLFDDLINLDKIDKENIIANPSHKDKFTVTINSN